MEEDGELFLLSESEDDGEVGVETYGWMKHGSLAPMTSGGIVHNNVDDTPAAPADRTALSIDEVIFGDTARNSRPLRIKSESTEITKNAPTSVSDVIVNSSGSSDGSSIVGVYQNGDKPGVGISSPCEDRDDTQEYVMELSVLRSMTCADVRAVLQPFFRRNELSRINFDKAREQLLCEASTPMSKVNRMMLERWRRLVNISNWNDGKPLGNDVLFPEVLLPPISSFPPLGDSTAAETEASACTTRKLRPHQLEGIRFLWSILAEGPVGKVPAIGCILAHTMGLGKTCQVVIFLHLFMAYYNRRRQRVLVVIPKTTRFGWCSEFTTWSQYFPLAQRIRPIVIDERDSGKRRVEMYTGWKREGGILLVGYEMLRGLVGNDTMLVNPTRKKYFYTDLLICDEAHRLKSTTLQISTALRCLNPLRRLLLTGTPLQNHLREYWAMVDFAVHKYFERRRFQEFFINPIEASVDRNASPREVAAARMKTFTLIRELRHFVQRVDSTPLQAELPPLHEYVVVISLSPLQSRLYNEFLKLARGNESRFNFLQAVTYANKISAHPQLLFKSDPASPVHGIRDDGSGSSSGSNRGDSSEEEEGEGEREKGSLAARPSRLSFKPAYNKYMNLFQAPPDYIPKSEDGAKLHVAINIVKAALFQGEKTLLFSLSTKLLDLFEGIIAEKNKSWQNDGSLSRPIRYCRLDGSHSGAEREDTLRSFASTGGADVFLLSMKAGGVGITITAATRVILLDTGFNPADDRQAIGRAYRYGQTRPVFVYRLMCYQTLEHRLFEQKVAKEWLFHTIVEEASLKRDALAGLRLRSMFQLLGRARALSNDKPPTLTEEQTNATAKLLAEDCVLADVAKHILYAESHEVYLQHDEFVQYGTEERAFYEEYQKNGVFYVDNVHEYPYGDEHSETHRFGRPREKHRQEITGQSKTLTALVDDIIRSRVEDDSQLRHILRMMGVTVDESGTVKVEATQQQETKQDEIEVLQRSGKKDREDDSVGEVSSTSSPRRKFPRNETVFQLRPVMLEDSDDDFILLDEKNGPFPLVDPAKYEKFKPGRDATCAIFIDEDEV